MAKKKNVVQQLFNTPMKAAALRNQGRHFFMVAHNGGDTIMKKKIVIHIKNLTAAQEVLLQELLQLFGAEQIEMFEDTTSTLLVGDLQIDVQRRQVWRAGSLIGLTPMEFDILHLLARRPGQVFSARQIYESVASDFAEGSWSGIGNMVYKLRRKVGSDLIKTVRNSGYYLPTRQ